MNSDSYKTKQNNIKDHTMYKNETSKKVRRYLSAR